MNVLFPRVNISARQHFRAWCSRSVTALSGPNPLSSNPLFPKQEQHYLNHKPTGFVIEDLKQTNVPSCTVLVVSENLAVLTRHNPVMSSQLHSSLTLKVGTGSDVILGSPERQVQMSLHALNRYRGLVETFYRRVTGELEFQ